MASEPMIDLDALDLGRVVASRDEILSRIRQRGRFALLDGILALGTTGEGMVLTVAERKRAAELFGKIIRKPTEVRDALDRLAPDMGGEGVRNADLIIEAVPEKLELKQKVYAGLEPKMKPMPGPAPAAPRPMPSASAIALPALMTGASASTRKVLSMRGVSFCLVLRLDGRADVDGG